MATEDVLANKLLQEDGFGILLEDGTGFLLLELDSVPGPPSSEVTIDIENISIITSLSESLEIDISIPNIKITTGINNSETIIKLEDR